MSATLKGRPSGAWAAALGEPFLAAWQAVARGVRRAFERHRQHRRAWGAYDALRRLDDRTLRDLGFDRSELSSIAAEFSGDAEGTKVRALESTSTRRIFYGRRS